ncbi:DUF4935 domain-containing protein (plasmid) [Deinococcus sp. D7000]|nr:DUF4935 domain-containing protein [Deinococcus sp. D7000]
MPLIVFFDTNALRKKNLSLDDELLLISEHARKYDIKLVISRVACLELENQSEREVKYIKQFYAEWGRVFKRQMVTDSEVFDLKDYSSEDSLYTPLKEKGFDIIENTTEDIYMAVSSMYKGLKPAKSQGTIATLGEKTTFQGKKIEISPFDTNYIDFEYYENGLKDVFIWRSGLSILKTNVENHMAFITSNTKDFCSNENKRVIHPDLAIEISERPDERIVVFSSMKDFLKYHVEFIEKFDLYAADVLRAVDLDYLMGLTTNYSDRTLIKADRFKIIEIEGVCQFSAILSLVFGTSHDNESNFTTYEEEVAIYIKVSRKGEDDGSDVYAIDSLYAIDEDLTIANGWKWPMAEDELLVQMLALKLERVRAEATQKGHE